MNSTQIYYAIANAHAAPEWAVFPEVADATGTKSSRRADAIALNLWPSRGLEIRGFEIKVSRSDLKRELVDPNKAEVIGSYCHTWCLAVPAGLIKDVDDIPIAWGIFEVKEDGSGKFKRLPTSRLADEVKVPSRLFIAAIARAACEQVKNTQSDWVRKSDIQKELDAEFERGRKLAPNEYHEELRVARIKITAMESVIAACGIADLNEIIFHRQRIINALNIGTAITHHWGDNAIEYLLRTLRTSSEHLNKTIETLSKLETKS